MLAAVASRAARAPARGGPARAASAARSSSRCCPTPTPAAAAAAAEKLRAEVAALTVEHDGADLGVTVSVGWATWEGESPEELLRRADDALYEAKRAGP